MGKTEFLPDVMDNFLILDILSDDGSTYYFGPRASEFTPREFIEIYGPASLVAQYLVYDPLGEYEYLNYEIYHGSKAWEEYDEDLGELVTYIVLSNVSVYSDSIQLKEFQIKTIGENTKFSSSEITYSEHTIGSAE